MIVGASLAGATAAVTLREEGTDGAVIMIGAEREPPYERPPLSKAYLRGDAIRDRIRRRRYRRGGRGDAGGESVGGRGG